LLNENFDENNNELNISPLYCIILMLLIIAYGFKSATAMLKITMLDFGFAFNFSGEIGIRVFFQAVLTYPLNCKY
jgi:hypothetical protein